MAAMGRPQTWLYNFPPRLVLTLQMPVYPFVYGIAVGSWLLVLVLAMRVLKCLADTLIP